MPPSSTSSTESDEIHHISTKTHQNVRKAQESCLTTIPRSFIEIFGKEPLNAPLRLVQCQYCERYLMNGPVFVQHQIQCREMCMVRILGEDGIGCLEWSDARVREGTVNADKEGSKETGVSSVANTPKKSGSANSTPNSDKKVQKRGENATDEDEEFDEDEENYTDSTPYSPSPNKRKINRKRKRDSMGETDPLPESAPTSPEKINIRAQIDVNDPLDMQHLLDTAPTVSDLYNFWTLHANIEREAAQYQLSEMMRRGKRRRVQQNTQKWSEMVCEGWEIVESNELNYDVVRRDDPNRATKGGVKQEVAAPEDSNETDEPNSEEDDDASDNEPPSQHMHTPLTAHTEDEDSLHESSEEVFSPPSAEKRRVSRRVSRRGSNVSSASGSPPVTRSRKRGSPVEMKNAKSTRTLRASTRSQRKKS